ncbi:MAG: hypothetical protein KTR27_07460 [Leptolyngbyaceae cyanobacterium MAG.088]|nr:hypothetical protein [Leptolyngbyaceae cyanobacterium MAG.088]
MKNSWRSPLLVSVLAIATLSQACKGISTTGANTATEAFAATPEESPQSSVCTLELDANPTPTGPYSVLDEQESPLYEIAGDDVFRTAALPAQTVTFDEQAMLSVLKATRTYFTDHGCQDPKILRAALLGTQNVQISDVLDTLDFMIQILEADLSTGQPTRLKDPTFINENFRVIRWLGFNPQIPSETRVRITKYAVFTHPGSRQRTDVFNIPVYKIKDEFVDDNFYTRYTKQDVLSGIYEPGGSEFGKVETLAYLTRDGFEDALLQGTALVTFADGSSTYFNVDINNGIAYVPGLGQRRQQRYWYFKEVNQLRGYGYNGDAKIPIEPGVTFAGDVLNIGLGKVVAIEDRYGNLRLGAIADTGGAFLPNLGQLDFFAGVFPTWDAYQQAVSTLPEYTRAYFLLKK